MTTRTPADVLAAFENVRVCSDAERWVSVAFDLATALRETLGEKERLKEHSDFWTKELIDHSCQMERERDQLRAKLENAEAVVRAGRAIAQKFDDTWFTALRAALDAYDKAKLVGGCA